MADTVLVFYFRGLGALAYVVSVSERSWVILDKIETFLPAPGAPIKIIRTPSVLPLDLRASGPPSACCSLASSCSTRASSLLTRSRRASTVSSLIGAIAACKSSCSAGPRQSNKPAMRTLPNTLSGRPEKLVRLEEHGSFRLGRRSVNRASITDLAAFRPVAVYGSKSTKPFSSCPVQ